MIKKFSGLAMAVLAIGGFLVGGCGGRKEYVSPYVQEENNPTYKLLYPGSFNTQPGPSATSGGDE
jgi:hypothetical protein